MKRKIFKIFLLIFLIAAVVWVKGGFRQKTLSATAQAVGDLTIDWGVLPKGGPIFVVDNFMPGDPEETREVTVHNGARGVRPIGVRGIETGSTSPLSDVLLMTVSVGGTSVFNGSKNLGEFFAESAGPVGIKLFDINPGETKTIIFKVKFPESAGDSYQRASVVFNLIIGLSYEIPTECLGIGFSGPAIFGTQGKDNLTGTPGNDLIFGLEGDDKFEGNLGDDCLVGGPGNDRLNGNNGNDVILGGEGNDIAHGNNGDDVIYGEGGNDTLNGENGKDKLIGGDGTDKIDGGNQEDSCEGEVLKNCELLLRS